MARRVPGFYCVIWDIHGPPSVPFYAGLLCVGQFCVIWDKYGVNLSLFTQMGIASRVRCLCSLASICVLLPVRNRRHLRVSICPFLRRRGFAYRCLRRRGSSRVRCLLCVIRDKAEGRSVPFYADGFTQTGTGARVGLALGEGWCTLAYASAWHYVTQSPQGRNAARVSGLWWVRGGFSYLPTVQFCTYRE